MKRFLFASILFAVSAGMQAQEKLPVYLDDSQPIEDRVQDALSRMTVEEKARLSYAQGKFSSPGCPRLGIPELWYSDGPHGVRAEINWNDWGYAGWTSDSCTAFPALTCLAATWNVELSGEYGKALGEEAVYRGKDVQLGPGVNIYRTPLNGRNFEYFSEDPYVTGCFAAAVTRGIKKGGSFATVKHFAANNQETARHTVDSVVSERALREIYLKGFEIAVKESAPVAIMTSYNRVNGVHAANSRALCTVIAREEWGFDGVLMSDWSTTAPEDGSIPWKCIEAGNDLIMPGSEKDDADIRQAYADGRLSEKKIRLCAGRIISLINKLDKKTKK